MAELTAAAFAAMIEHMNDDHADAVVAYARHFGGCTDVASATITAMDAAGLTLAVETGEGTRALPIPFEREVVDSDDARGMLISMWRSAAPADLKP